MCMYLGKYQSKFTGKGRIVLPRELRRLTGNKIVLKKGLDGCVEGYGFKAWEEKNQDKLNLSEDKAERFTNRVYLASVEMIDLDRQGRFVIPPKMRKFGKIKGQALILGVGDHFEIWDEKLWTKQVSRLELGYEG